VRTIWKFPAPIDNEVVIHMPKGAKVLCVQMQHGDPCLWAEVDSEAEVEPMRFFWRGTGHSVEFPFLVGYVGTVQMMDGTLVFHLYKKIDGNGPWGL
jgi:hypothetical protein